MAVEAVLDREVHFSHHMRCLVEVGEPRQWAALLTQREDGPKLAS